MWRLSLQAMYEERLARNRMPEPGYHWCRCGTKIKDQYQYCYPCQRGIDLQVKEAMRRIKEWDK